LVQRDVLGLVVRDLGKAHLREQRAQQLDVGRGIFDEFEPVGAHRVIEPEDALFLRQLRRHSMLLRGPSAPRAAAFQGRFGMDAPDGWSVEEGGKALTRTFKLADFSEAFGFLSRVALHAEKVDHHPELTSVWKRVDFRLTSHDAGGVTDRDIALAEAISRLA